MREGMSKQMEEKNTSRHKRHLRRTHKDQSTRSLSPHDSMSRSMTSGFKTRHRIALAILGGSTIIVSDTRKALIKLVRECFCHTLEPDMNTCRINGMQVLLEMRNSA